MMGSNKRMSKSDRADLIFPVARVLKMLRKGNYSNRTGAGAAVFLASVIQYMVSEVIELAGDISISKRKRRITPRHIMLACRQDDELNIVFKDVIISNGGSMEHIEEALLQKNKRVRTRK